MSDRPSIAAPTLVSLLICDQVIDDRLSNKKSAIGLFNTVLVPSVPTRIQQMAVMATLTEISGRTPLQLRLMRDEDNRVLLQTQGHVDAPDPLVMVDLVFAMQGVPVGSAGQYAFELLSQGELLGRRRFQVRIGRPRPPKRAPPPGAIDPRSGP
ncbi:MAG: hypothetical protein ACE5I3_00345 [Phycisphaerae bacterium]